MALCFTESSCQYTGHIQVNRDITNYHCFTSGFIDADVLELLPHCWLRLVLTEEICPTLLWKLLPKFKDILNICKKWVVRWECFYEGPQSPPACGNNWVYNKRKIHSRQFSTSFLYIFYVHFMTFFIISIPFCHYDCYEAIFQNATEKGKTKDFLS